MQCACQLPTVEGSRCGVPCTSPADTRYGLPLIPDSGCRPTLVGSLAAAALVVAAATAAAAAAPGPSYTQPNVPNPACCSPCVDTGTRWAAARAPGATAPEWRPPYDGSRRRRSLSAGGVAAGSGQGGGPVTGVPPQLLALWPQQRRQQRPAAATATGMSCRLGLGLAGSQAPPPPRPTRVSAAATRRVPLNDAPPRRRRVSLDAVHGVGGGWRCYATRATQRGCNSTMDARSVDAAAAAVNRRDGWNFAPPCSGWWSQHHRSFPFPT